MSGNVGGSTGVQQWCDKEQPYRSTLSEPLFPFCNSLQQGMSAYFLLTLQEYNWFHWSLLPFFSLCSNNSLVAEKTFLLWFFFPWFFPFFCPVLQKKIKLTWSLYWIIICYTVTHQGKNLLLCTSVCDINVALYCTTQLSY